MVDSTLADGVRIAQLLASDLVGHEGRLATVSVTDADPDVEPTPDGSRAYAVQAGDESLATAFVHPERVRLDFRCAPEAVVDAASEAGLRVRPKAVDPPRTVIFVEDGAEVKRALSVFERAVAAR
ncbi:hypothetical protein ACOZ4L_00255 [Haloplanus ruber]|uniref:DUF7993 domain-containing protein n=1 Tax=Haloplanus ruber TaxID=869892 RepID=A0ABD6D1G3_9EURY|nr:hypothetical protein [Haloplanus ruber]